MDLRGQRTRIVIADALRQLLAARPLDEINVSEIVAAAGVSRSSFYAHFADKHELACHLLAPVMHGLANAVITRRCDADLQNQMTKCLRDRIAVLGALRSSVRETIRRSIATEILRGHRGIEQDCRSRIAATSVAEAQLMIIELALSEREPMSGNYMAQLIQEVANGTYEAVTMAALHNSAAIKASANA